MDELGARCEDEVCEVAGDEDEDDSNVSLGVYAKCKSQVSIGQREDTLTEPEPDAR